MNRNVKDSPDELLRKLHETLADQSKESEGEATPDDVFVTPSTHSEHASSDEDIAAFDSYMAELLGELVLEEKQTKESKEGQQPAAYESAPVDVPDSEIFELTDAEQEQLLPERDAYEADDDDVEEYLFQENTIADEAISDKMMSDPDVRAELSEDVIGEEYEHEQQTISADHHDEPVRSFEVIEQLSISQNENAVPVDATQGEPGEIQAEDQPNDDTIGEIEQDVIAEPVHEVSEEQNELNMPEPQAAAAEQYDMTDDGMADTVEQDTDAESEEQELSPVVLREGDMLLDEADEIPSSPQNLTSTVKSTVALNEKTMDEQSPGPIPVASPLDAARDRHDMTAKTEEPPAPRPKQSPLDAMAARAQGNVEAPSEIPVFGKRQSRERTLTDDDVELLLDLGYEANLTQKVGSQRVEAIRYRRQDDEEARRRLRHVYGCAGEEYSSHAQDKQIKDIYRRQTNSAVVRLVLEILLALLMLLTDLLPTMTDRLPSAVAGLPMSSAFGLIGIVLLVLSIVVLLPLLKRGAKALVRCSPIPSSMPVLLLVFTLLYDVIILFYGDCGILLNFPTGMSLVILAAAEILTVMRERTTFDVVCAHSRKIVMHPISPRKKKMVRDSHIVKIINDDVGQRAWRVHPTDQVAGYFRRNGEGTVRYRLLSALLLSTILIAFVVGLVTLIVTDAPKDALTAFLLAAQMALPVSGAISYAYPMFFAARALSAQGCAIVGQGAVDEYAGEKTLIFDDTEMFRSKSSTEITIKGSGDTKKYIRYAKRLFRTLGGTLRGISTSDLSEETYEERVEILKIFERGVEARIDDKVNILMGSSAFMVQHGIRVPGESAELLVRRNVESSILYLAFDGKLRLGYEVDYRISGRFEQMAAELARTGTAVAIESCDPSIQNDFLTRSRKAGQPSIAVTKPARFERHTESLLCDSGVIATRSARDIARATATCDRLLENDQQLSLFHRIAPVFGGVLVLALSLFGLVTRGMTVIAALLQMVWCIPTLLLTRKNLTNEQQAENEHVDRNRK